MATKKPLVITNGQIEQLQAGDIIENMEVFGDPGGRLSLSSTAAIPISDLSGITQLFYVPHRHNWIRLYVDGTWQNKTFDGIPSINLPVPGSDTVYDVFAYYSTLVELELVAWTSKVLRTAELARGPVENRWVKSGDSTRLYLGTIYVRSDGTCDDTARYRHVFNAYNRTVRPFYWTGPLTDWTYSSSTIRYVNAGTPPSISVVVGLAETTINLELSAVCNSASTSSISVMLIGIDSTTAGIVRSRHGRRAGNTPAQPIAAVSEITPVGYHEYNWLEQSADGVTMTFFGSDQRAGLIGNMVL